MKMEIVKVRRSAAFDHILFVDVLIKELDLVIKGIRYNVSLNNFFFPCLKTEGGRPFTPVCFSGDGYQQFKDQFLELIQDEKIPKEIEEITDEQKKKILAPFERRAAKKTVQRGLAGPQKAPSPGKPQRGPKI